MPKTEAQKARRKRWKFNKRKRDRAAKLAAGEAVKKPNVMVGAPALGIKGHSAKSFLLGD